MNTPLCRLFFLICLCCAVSCQQKATPCASTGLEFADAQKVWRLYSINGKKIDAALPDRQIPFIVFSSVDSRVIGSGGCNRFRGSLKLETNKRLKIGPLAATRMACLNMTDENEFFIALDEVISYQIHDNELILLSPDDEDDKKTILVFRPFLAAKQR